MEEFLLVDVIIDEHVFLELLTLESIFNRRLMHIVEVAFAEEHRTEQKIKTEHAKKNIQRSRRISSLLFSIKLLSRSRSI